MQKLTIVLLAACALSAVATDSGAQTGGAPKSGTRLITVGTGGGPVPRAGRAQSSNLLIVNGTPYLIDAGDGIARRLAKMKFNFRTLGTIFITHGHNDHTGGLGICCRRSGARNARSRSTSTGRPDRGSGQGRRSTISIRCGNQDQRRQPDAADREGVLRP